MNRGQSAAPCPTGLANSVSGRIALPPGPGHYTSISVVGTRRRPELLSAPFERCGQLRSRLKSHATVGQLASYLGRKDMWMLMSWRTLADPEDAALLIF